MVDIKGLYFSGRYFSRDLIGTIAPITAVSVAFTCSYEPALEAAAHVFRDYLAGVTFWAFVLVLIVYLVCAYFVGAVANILGNFIHAGWQRVPRFGKTSSYAYWYNENAKDIDAIYQRLFPNYPILISGAAAGPTDKINTLKEYLRVVNPGGYADTYRQFLKVDMVRSAMVYGSALAIFYLVKAPVAGDTHLWIAAGLSLVVVILAFRELPRRVRKVVRAEYQFIKATARLKDDSAIA